ncbi:MAG: hypothetical protein ACPHJ3_19790, partial [Rubripirellula sp.]
RSIIVFTHDPKPPEVATGVERKGELQIGDLKVAGVLAPTAAKDLPSAQMQFRWRPYGSTTAATMETTVAGT